MRAATDAQIETAIEVLRAYDGESEPDNQRDVDAVIVWLEQFVTDRMVRAQAREAGVPVARLRKVLAE